MFELNLLPEQADNRYQGNRYALWFFVAFLLLMTWRSIIHMLFEETGYFDIANFVLLVGEPDPMPVVFRFFSLWGFAQLIFCMVCWLVVFRYRSLIPLMYLFWLFEWAGRLWLYPLIREDLISTGIYTNGVTPGVSGAPFVFGLLILFFALSIKRAG